MTICAKCDGDGYTETWNDEQNGVVITLCDCADHRALIATEREQGRAFGQVAEAARDELAKRCERWVVIDRRSGKQVADFPSRDDAEKWARADSRTGYLQVAASRA